MGWSNSVSVFHGHITYILKDEIPDTARQYIDDITIKGGKTEYKDENGIPEAISENSGIRRFVYEYLVDLNRVLHRLKRAGVTISAKKISLCVPEISILGHRCNKNGRIPDNSHVKKILNWPICKSLTDVRAFLGVCNLLRIFVKNYAQKASPLIKLTRKDAPFEIGTEEIQAMETLKQAVTQYPVLKPMEYDKDLPVRLAVDSSNIAAGWILFQEDKNGKRHPVRYGSRIWRDHEVRYSQAKLELLGLLVALRAVQPYVMPLQKFTVEVDAEYIKGMINNPESIPNATISRWVALIRLFDFELVHVPADKHKAPDGMSRKAPTEEDVKEADSDN